MGIEDKLSKYTPRTYEDLEAEVAEKGDELAKELIDKTFLEAYIRLGVATHVYDSKGNLVLTLDEEFGNHKIKDINDGWAAIRAASTMMPDAVLADHNGHTTVMPLTEAYEKKPLKLYQKIWKGIENTIMYILTATSIIGLVALAGCTEKDSGDVCDNKKCLTGEEVQELYQDTNDSGGIDHIEGYNIGDTLYIKDTVGLVYYHQNTSSEPAECRGKTWIVLGQADNQYELTGFYFNGDYSDKIKEGDKVFVSSPIIESEISTEDTILPDLYDEKGKNKIKLLN